MAGRPLSRERIVEAAVDLADAEGLDAVSMRRVAQRLDAGTMSLYRHVSDKDALVQEMVENLFARYAYPDPEGLDWRARFHVLARRDWRMYMAHPWLLAVTVTRTPPSGPHALASMEWALRAIEPLGLGPADAGRAIMAVTHYLQGSAQLALGTREGREGRVDEPESDPGTVWRARLDGVDLSAFPRLRALLESEAADGGGKRGEREEHEERDWVAEGLDMVLDGIEARAATAGARGGPETSGAPGAP